MGSLVKYKSYRIIADVEVSLRPSFCYEQMVCATISGAAFSRKIGEGYCRKVESAEQTSKWQFFRQKLLN